MSSLRRALFALATIAAGLIPVAASAMSLGFSWSGVAACSSRSPAFTLSGVPAGTKRLAFRMVDLNLPSYPHGGSTIDYQGGKVAAGAVSYTGPCPPAGQQHNYSWTVQAMDAAGKTLATATAARPFPPR